MPKRGDRRYNSGTGNLEEWAGREWEIVSHVLDAETQQALIFVYEDCKTDEERRSFDDELAHRSGGMTYRDWIQVWRADYIVTGRTPPEWFPAEDPPDLWPERIDRFERFLNAPAPTLMDDGRVVPIDGEHRLGDALS